MYFCLQKLSIFHYNVVYSYYYSNRNGSPDYERNKKQIDKEWNKIMFNVAICDDDKNFIQYVEDIIKELGYAEDVKFLNICQVRNFF